MKTRFLLPAHHELIEAVRYYNAQRIQLGDEFRDEAWKTIRRINDFSLRLAEQATGEAIH